MFRNKIQRIYKCHCIPAHSTSPAMLRLSGDRICPTFLATDVTGMTVKTVLGVISMAGYCNKLIDNILIILYTVVTKSIFGIERCSHINAIQPHLIGINFLMPETSILIAWMGIELATQQVYSFLIFLIFRLFINTKQEFTRVQTVNVIFMQFISLDASIIVYHCVCVSQRIVEYLFISISIIHIQHSLQFQSMTIVPFQFGLEIQLPGFWATNHL